MLQTGSGSLKFIALSVAVFCLTARLGSAFSTDSAGKSLTSDGSFSDTVAALAAAKAKGQDGWTLIVGIAGGNYTWPDQLVVDLQRDFTLTGASAETPTTIKSTYVGGIAIFVNAGVKKVFTMQNFSFAGWSAAGRLIEIVGTGECFRLSNLTVTGTYQNSAWLWIADPSYVGGGDGPFGLVDHCTLNGYAAAFVRQNRSSSDANWANDHAIKWGTRDAVFFEDNTYTGVDSGAPSFITDGNQAGKVVVRHCTLKNVTVGWHGRDSGGTALVDYKQGFLSGEVYANTYNVTRPMGVPLVMIRSGTALIWGNSLNVSGAGSVTTGAQLLTLCASGEYVNCLLSSTGSPMTQPLAYPADWPDAQQAGLPQPVRAWENGNRGAITYGWCVGDSSFTAPDREYFVSDDASAKPASYTPFTYPHPLQSNQVTRPAPPSNVHVSPPPAS